MKHAKYFEGTLQLRNCDKETVKQIENLMNEYNVTVAKKIKQKNGYDYKVSSNKFLTKMHNIFPKKFNGITKLTRKLFSRDNQTGKNIYRLTLLFKHLPFKVGDIIEYQEDKVKVMRISDKITVKNIETGKREFMDF